VGFSGKRTETHGTRLEAAYYALHRFHLFQGNRGTCRNKFQKPPQCMGMSGVIHQLCIFLKALIGTGSHSLLECDDGLGTVEVILTALSSAKGMEADRVQCRIDT
jgi:hypothetical protein